MFCPAMGLLNFCAYCTSTGRTFSQLFVLLIDSQVNVILTHNDVIIMNNEYRLPALVVGYFPDQKHEQWPKL